MPEERWTYLALGLLGGGVLAGFLFWLSSQAANHTVVFEVVRDDAGRIVEIRKRELGAISGRQYSFKRPELTF